jgi:hypothetical protein
LCTKPGSFYEKGRGKYVDLREKRTKCNMTNANVRQVFSQLRNDREINPVPTGRGERANAGMMPPRRVYVKESDTYRVQCGVAKTLIKCQAVVIDEVYIVMKRRTTPICPPHIDSIVFWITKPKFRPFNIGL